jgi:hypothetical protein
MQKLSHALEHRARRVLGWLAGWSNRLMSWNEWNSSNVIAILSESVAITVKKSTWRDRLQLPEPANDNHSPNEH